MSETNPANHYFEIFIDGIVVCRTLDSSNLFNITLCNMEKNMAQGDAIIFDIKGQKYIGHVQRFITAGIFQLMEKNLQSLRSQEELEFYEINLENKQERFLSHTSSSYFTISSDNGETEWHTQVPRVQIFRDDKEGW